MRARFFVPMVCLFAGALTASHSGRSRRPDQTLGITTLQLWPDDAPEVADTAAQDLPTLTVFAPQGGHETGAAVIVAPGGAYRELPTNNQEGRQAADWFANLGMTAFVLRYRVGPHYPFPIPLEDAQRAVRVVRSMAEFYRYSPDRVGFVGFSAGGHLAAVSATLSHPAGLQTGDRTDRLSDRPDFLVLAYPWLNAMQPSGSSITYCSVLKTIPASNCQLFEHQYTPAAHVTGQTPTTFIYSTTDDDTVPIHASLDFYTELVKAQVPVELHIFRHGAHGSGLGTGSVSLDQWPVLLEHWLRDEGFLTPLAK
jgi:acetyl esterase/lipase